MNERLFEAIYSGDNLYHTCSIEALKYILKNNTISGRNAYIDSGDTLGSICVSRSRRFNIRTTKEDPISAQIVLDKNAIKSRYKIVPFTDKNKRLMHDDNGDFIQTAYEERIITPSIPTVSKYITEINIFILEDFIEDEDVLKKLKWARNKLKMLSCDSKVYTYRLSDLSNGSENMYEMFNIKPL